MKKGYDQFTKTEGGTTIAAAGLPAVAWVATVCRWEFLREIAEAVLTGVRAIDATLYGLTQIGELVPCHQVSKSSPLRHRRHPEAQCSRLTASGSFANRPSALAGHHAKISLHLSRSHARVGTETGNGALNQAATKDNE
jgi:hypothetical protein